MAAPPTSIALLSQLLTSFFVCFTDNRIVELLVTQITRPHSYFSPINIRPRITVFFIMPRVAACRTPVSCAPDFSLKCEALNVVEDFIGIRATPHIIDAVFRHVFLDPFVLVKCAHAFKYLNKLKRLVFCRPYRATTIHMLAIALQDVIGFSHIVFAVFKS